MSEIERLKAAIATAPNVPLGDLIEPVLGQVNKDGFDYPFMGVNIAKQIVPTVANTSTVNPRKYVYIKNRQFVFSGMQTGRDECIRFTIYTGNTPVLLSPAYTILQVKDSNVVIPEYIFANFLSSEMDRLGWFYSDSSVRANLDLPRFLDIKIPLPPIEVQQQYVDAYSGLRKLAEENEALLEPLSKACQAYLAEVQTQYSEVLLGDYIVEVNERNENGEFTADYVRGVSIQKKFIDTKANMDGVSVRNYKVVRPDDFAFNVNTARMGEKFAIALSSINCIVTSIYGVFRVKRIEDLDPAYLYLYFNRTEFDRYVRFNSWGSARETFNMPDVFNIRIPLPPIEVQQSIVALHRCAEEARSIAAKARETLNSICPAMIQRAAHEMH